MFNNLESLLICEVEFVDACELRLLGELTLASAAGAVCAKLKDANEQAVTSRIVLLKENVFMIIPQLLMM